MKWTAAYVLAIIAVNYGFSITTPIELVGGVFLPPTTFIVGGIFVLRDLAQREVGHRVWFAMLAGCALSWFMADPFVAVASAAAFLVSEAADWAVYTRTKKPLRDRILWSSALSTPLDSIVFLGLIGHLTLPAVLVMTASKMVAALLVWGVMSKSSPPDPLCDKQFWEKENPHV